MSNRNHNLSGSNGTANTETGNPVKERFITINWKKIGKTAAKVAIGGCALVGAAGIGSYAADRIHDRRSIPEAPKKDVDVKLTDI